MKGVDLCMGTMTSVRCRACGYREHALYGVGGDCGMTGELVVTAVCTESKRLVDTVPPGQGSFSWVERIRELDAPLPVGPCPEKQCGSTTHEAWNDQMATCPACGERGMEISEVGCWD